MHEVESERFTNQRRRSERLSQPLPLLIRGIDLLGQPFEERTATLAYNLHGCRYSSKHHLPQNAWVTLEVQRTGETRNVRARVAWSQRPQSIRDFFQVGVELETPANIWGLDCVPPDWELATSSNQIEQQRDERLGVGESAPIMGNIEGSVANEPFDSPLHAFFPSPAYAQSDPEGQNPPEQSPLLRELNEELRRQAREAVEAAAARVADDIRSSVEEVHQQRLATAEEFFQAWKGEFERTQRGAHDTLSEQLNTKQQDFLNGMKLELEGGLLQARQLLEELQQQAQVIRSEVAVATEPGAQPGEAAAARPSPADPESSALGAKWNERLEQEMSRAQSQWNELLQSSLDSGIERLSAHISEHSMDLLRNAEQRLTQRFEEFRQPLTETAGEAREVLNGIRAELEQEMSRARASLVDIENTAGRIKDYSTQLEASSHDTLNEIHRRLENILESQTEELNRRAEHLASGLSQRLNPIVETLGQQLVERTVSEVEAKVAPWMERVPELLRELSAREMQSQESLRLHRERLRQVAENSQRDAAAEMASSVSSLREEVDATRKAAFAKWEEDLNTSGARLSQSASEAIGQASEWFQGETRARLQVMVEQSLSTAGNNFNELASQSARKFADELEQQSSLRVAEAQKQIDGASSEVGVRHRSQLDEAAQVAAASFGQVLREVSDQQMEQFTLAARNAVQERMHELDSSAQQILANLSVSGEASLEGFRARMASESEASVSQGRNALSGELTAVLDRFAGERETRQREWSEGLERISNEATAKHQERLETACDSWIVSSVRRLSEHGQSSLESLLRFADQALRDSCCKVFEDLAETMRARSASAAGTAAFVPIPPREATENSAAQ